ncbi:hypothetical protein ACS0TY_006398 [Phlomoides rotata]
MAKIFTLDDVAEHNTQNDCWLTIFGKVLDVTSFLDEHPGGDEVLLKATGKDATAEFLDVGHTHDAWEKLDTFCIGEIDKSTIPNDTEATPSQKQAQKSNYIYIFKFLIPFILFNLLLAFYSKSSAS